MQRTHGFSLLEALLVLGVAGSLLAVAAQPVAGLYHHLQLQSFTSDLLHPLMLARNRALKGDVPVTLCKSADGSACTGQGRWEQGWIVYEDRNRNGRRDAGEPVLHHVQGLPSGWHIHASAPLGHYVSYGPMGTSQLVSGAFQAGTFTVCRASLDRSEARQVVLNAGGRPRVQKVWLDSCA